MNQTVVNKRVIGIDISLESTTYAVIDVRGNILAKSGFCTKDYPRINDYISALSEHILDLIEANGGYELIRSIGISAKSANYLSGCIENAPNMPWKGVIPLANMLRDRLGMAVAVANNAHVAALGEHAFGCAHGMKDFIIVTLGHGMGSSVFSNGHVHLGNDGFAGEIGHTCVKLDGRLCGCGKRGCLEAYTAAKGIVQTAQELMKESDEPSLMRGVEQLSPKMISDFCNQGDKLAIEVYRQTGEILGLGLANYVTVLDPEAIIFTGGISRAGDWLMAPAFESYEEHVFKNVKGKVRFLVSTIDDKEQNLLGASVLAWEQKEYSLFK